MTPAKAYRLQNGKEADSNLKAKWEAEAKKKRELEGRTGGGGGNKMAERVLLRVSQKLEGKREFLGGLLDKEVAYSMLTMQPLVWFPEFPNFFQRKIYWCCWLEESGQLLENVDPTHLVLACGMSVLQKREFLARLFSWKHFTA